MKQSPLRSDGLQLDEHRGFQERFWKIERVGWLVFAILIVAALFGAFGAGGPLATKVVEAQGATIEHPRVGRWESADEMTVRFKPGRDTYSVELSPSFAEAFQVEDIQPLPAKTTIGARGQVLTFESPARDGGSIKLHVRAQSVGMASYEVSVNGAPSTTLSTFILP